MEDNLAKRAVDRLRLVFTEASKIEIAGHTLDRVEVELIFNMAETTEKYTIVYIKGGRL